MIILIVGILATNNYIISFWSIDKISNLKESNMFDNWH